MNTSQNLSLAGSFFGIVAIVLGIVALTTPTWLVLTAPQQIRATYSLFKRCNEPLSPLAGNSTSCKTLDDFQTPQGLLIAGFVLLGLGIIVSILLGILVKSRWIKLAPQILLIIGSTLTFIGILFYVRNVLANFTAGTTKLDLGYSFILIVITCIIGYIASSYFIFAAGIEQGYGHGRVAVSPRK